MKSPRDAATCGKQVPTDVLALLPSAGLGGGIEAYAAAVLEQLEDRGIRVQRIALHNAQPLGRAPLRQRVGFALGVLRRAVRLRRSMRPAVFIFHPSFAVLGLLVRLLAGDRPGVDILFFLGQEIWSASATQRYVWSAYGLQRVAISTFSAGALARVGPCSLLPPGIPRTRYNMLKSATAARTGRRNGQVPALLTVFRLDAAASKGARELLQAVDQLRVEGFPVQLRIAGVGPAPNWLIEAATQRAAWVDVIESPSSEELSQLFGASDLFVLATRLGRQPASGEGFGIVLVEAALAGMAVVAPALDGSADAFLPGVTGLRPVDGSIEALHDVLAWCLEHPAEVAAMGRSGQAWAAAMFHPDGYAARVGQVLFGETPNPSLELRLEPLRGTDQ